MRKFIAMEFEGAPTSAEKKRQNRPPLLLIEEGAYVRFVRVQIICIYINLSIVIIPSSPISD